MMDIKPIRNEADYQAALARVDTLMDARPGSDAGDELDVLTTLIEAYEAQRHRIDAPDPVEAIKFRMEQQGLTRKDLEPYLGHSGRVAEVINRQRGLSLNMIRSLHHGLGIPLESLIQPLDKAS